MSGGRSGLGWDILWLGIPVGYPAGTSSCPFFSLNNPEAANVPIWKEIRL